MKRPDLEDFKYRMVFREEPGEYLDDLEKYCDELEEALDKACKELYLADLTISMVNSSNNLLADKLGVAHDSVVYKKKTEDEWKEWCLKNE